ncbi:prolyl oligopeptidase [Syncephalis fuscata]|nr:prolyl oligopeptidase [Syncephalis fuscata]
MHLSLSKLLFVLALAIELNLPIIKATPLDHGDSAQPPVVATNPDTGNKASPAQSQVNWKYPIVRRDHNETKAFVKDQNKLTDSYLSRNSQRNAYISAVTKLSSGNLIRAPMKAGNYYYTIYQSNPDKQSILYKQKSLDAEKTVFFDPNKWDKNDVISIDRTLFSSSGKYFGYIMRRTDNDWGTIRIRCVEDGPHCKAGQDAIDEVKWTKFFTLPGPTMISAFFTHGGDKAANTGASGRKNSKVYYHRLGTQQSSDQLIAEYPEAPTYTIFPLTSNDGRWLIVRVTDNKRNEDVWMARMGEDGSVPKKITFNKIANDMNGYHNYITNIGDRLYFYTDKNAPRSKVITYDMAAPEKGFVDLIPQHEKDVLYCAYPVGGDYLLLEFIKDTKSALSIHQLSTGKKIPTIYRYDVKSDTLSVINELKIPGFNPKEFETRQVFIKSKDNVKFSMFITARKGISLDKSHPTILFGDGGFSYSQMPQFTTLWGAFLKHFNGIVAVANIRGGGEYGTEWRKAGMLQKKQNTFDDFQSAAKYLSEQGYTKPSLLTLQGDGTGGLAVTATANQAPELFGCGLTNSGLTDMLRFHNEFEYLLRYSPLHNVDASKTYPALLLSTSGQLDHISSFNSYKLAAELQYKLPKNPNPLMLRVNYDANAQSSTTQINQIVDKLSFMAMSLNLKWHD